MIERLSPDEYQERQVSDTSDPEAYLDKELSELEEEKTYVYGLFPEQPKKKEPKIQYVPIGQAENTTTTNTTNTTIPWGLIGIIAITGLIALGIVAVAKK